MNHCTGIQRIILALILFVCAVPGYNQVSVSDSIRKIITGEMSKEEKIDEINRLIFQFAPTHPEIVLMYSDTAIAYAVSMNDSVRLANSISRKGLAHYYLGDFNASLDNYFAALNIKNRIGATDEIYREYNNIGLVLRNLEQNEEALKHFTLAFEFLEKEQNKVVMATILNNIGISLRGLGRLDEAEESLYRALALNNQTGSRQSLAHNLNNLGNIYFYKKDYSRARANFYKALEINRELFNRYEEAQILNNLAEINLQTGDFAKTKQYLTEASLIIDEIKAFQLKLTNLNIYARYYRQEKDFEKALDMQDKYNQLRDSLFFAIRITQFDQLKAIAEAEKNLQRMQFLEEISTIQQEKIRFQMLFQTGTILVIIIILLLVVILYRNLQVRKRLNKVLSDRSQEVELLNKELKAFNEELATQRDDLEKTLTELREAQNQLVQSEKMATLGMLAAGVAHEINNPLNFIMGGYTGLEAYFEEIQHAEDETITLLMRSIKEGITRARDIVKALGQFSRGNSSLSEICDIHKIIDNALVMTRFQYKNRIDIVKNYSEKPLIVSGNVGQIHQIFVNLMSNAIDAIEGDGNIVLSTMSENGFAEIQITDSGHGISNEVKAKILEPFFTTKDPGKGTGLGLPITWNIIREHNGSMHFESEPGKGTKVTIRLPLLKV